MNPAAGSNVREMQRRRGIKPTDHHRQNLAKLREQSAKNQARKLKDAAEKDAMMKSHIGAAERAAHRRREDGSLVGVADLANEARRLTHRRDVDFHQVDPAAVSADHDLTKWPHATRRVDRGQAADLVRRVAFLIRRDA